MTNPCGNYKPWSENPYHPLAIRECLHFEWFDGTCTYNRKTCEWRGYPHLKYPEDFRFIPREEEKCSVSIVP
jgi:hypothetical protein